MIKNKVSSILKGSIEKQDDDFKYNITPASIKVPPIPRKYKHIKNQKQNRTRNILLAIENLISQIGPDEPSTLREILYDFHREMKPKWWDK